MSRSQLGTAHLEPGAAWLEIDWDKHSRVSWGHGVQAEEGGASWLRGSCAGQGRGSKEAAGGAGVEWGGGPVGMKKPGRKGGSRPWKRKSTPS